MEEEEARYAREKAWALVLTQSHVAEEGHLMGLTKNSPRTEADAWTLRDPEILLAVTAADGRSSHAY